jgi:hypothetical protein
MGKVIRQGIAALATCPIIVAAALIAVVPATMMATTMITATIMMMAIAARNVLAILIARLKAGIATRRSLGTSSTITIVPGIMMAVIRSVVVVDILAGLEERLDLRSILMPLIKRPIG